jgi:hypothetical protein
VRDAKKLELERLFGTGEAADSTLSRLAREHPGANVILYYAGLGATDDRRDLSAARGRRAVSRKSGAATLSTLYAIYKSRPVRSCAAEADFGREQGPDPPPNAPETMRSVPRRLRSRVSLFRCCGPWSAG